jgi:hypothetical protein
MQDGPLFLSWSIHLPSKAGVEEVSSVLNSLNTESGFMLDEVRASPGGCEARRIEPHRIGNYFDNIYFNLYEDDPLMLRLTFQRSPAAGRFWKDVMVHVLNSIRRKIPDVRLAIDYKGDTPPPPKPE